MMRIKTKLRLGVGLLFFLITLLGAVGLTYIHVLKTDTENILVANYQSLELLRHMLLSVEENVEDVRLFEENLRKQEQNITESGEKEATDLLRTHFEQYRATKNPAIKPHIRQNIFAIMDMNMQAIRRKSNIANATAVTATLWITMTGTLCFFIAFVLLIRLPSTIANPIRTLTESIRHIAQKQYSERVHFQGHQEFAELAYSFNTMAQKLQEYDNSTLSTILAEKKRIEAIVNTMNDPVIGFDEDLTVLFVNEEAENIIGLPKSALVGLSAHILANNNDLLRILIQALTLPDGQEGKSPTLKIYANGKESYFEQEIVHIATVAGASGVSTLSGYVILLRNITKFQERDFAKTNFIATVSHEFKTPISSIKLSLQLLENERIGALNSEQKNLLTSIQDDADRLLKITGELLNMTQVESGNIQLSVLPSDALEILNYAVNATKIQAEKKNITLRIESPKNQPKVLADSEKTAWVLTNLTANAIRYSHENTEILLKLFEHNGTVFFSVTDTGQGIAPQYKDKIFNRYFRIPGTKKEGTGLGLSISKEFIEAQGGNITVESELGVGSTFTVTLKSAEIHSVVRSASESE